MKETVVILDNIRSTHNVGSVFRTSDAAGVAKVYLCGYTPAPIDRFGRVQKDIAKTALGAQDSVAWEQGSIEEVVAQLKADGYTICSVEQDARSVDMYSYERPEKVAFIFGNEVDGVSDDVRNVSDTILEIPMAGEKESLNVSVTVGIILFCCW